MPVRAPLWKRVIDSAVHALRGGTACACRTGRLASNSEEVRLGALWFTLWDVQSPKLVRTSKSRLSVLPPVCCSFLPLIIIANNERNGRQPVKYLQT